MVSHTSKALLQVWKVCKFLTLWCFVFFPTKDKVKRFVESKKSSKGKGEKKRKQTLYKKHFRVLMQPIREQKELSGSYLAVVAIVNVVFFHY